MNKGNKWKYKKNILFQLKIRKFEWMFVRQSYLNCWAGLDLIRTEIGYKLDLEQDSFLIQENDKFAFFTESFRFFSDQRMMTTFFSQKKKIQFNKN